MKYGKVIECFRYYVVVWEKLQVLVMKYCFRCIEALINVLI